MSDRPLRILFNSYHSYLDPSSGSTISLRDLFKLLAARGWECQAFSGPQLDYEDSKRIPELLKYVGLPFQGRKGKAHGTDFELYNAIIDGVPTALYETPDLPPARKLTEAQGRVHLALFEKVLEQFKPDIVLTYGGQIMAQQAMAMARNAGAAVVFWLRNTAYNTRPFFRLVNGVLVPSNFSVEFYRRTIGLPCTAIPSPIDWERIHCPHVDRKHLTFVNPTPVKGVFWFAGIARELAARRPDIPMLVVESRGKANWLEKAGLNLERMPSLKTMPNTRDPRKFLGVTKLLLAPSVWQETFGRVTAEAMTNGIPVLASSRGGLPEVVGKGGFVFNLPNDFTGETRTLPTAEHLEPWLKVIIRLWDDQSTYVTACLRARGEAEKWKPEVLGERYDRYFRDLLKMAQGLAPEPEVETPELVETAEAPVPPG